MRLDTDSSMSIVRSFMANTGGEEVGGDGSVHLREPGEPGITAGTGVCASGCTTAVLARARAIDFNAGGKAQGEATATGTSLHCSRRRASCGSLRAARTRERSNESRALASTSALRCWANQQLDLW